MSLIDEAERRCVERSREEFNRAMKDLEGGILIPHPPACIHVWNAALRLAAELTEEASTEPGAATPIYWARLEEPC
jgi:hypothetical protein